jgi:uncharacterized peroxidase-related enzyme
MTAKAKAAKKEPAKKSRKRDMDGIMALDISFAERTPAVKAFFDKCDEKIGFVPNVLLSFSHDMTKLDAFSAYYNDLMLAPSGLSKLEREMISVVVSSENKCFYCLVAHGEAVRRLSGDPALGEMLVMNYRAADLPPRQRAMLDFTVKMTKEPWAIVDDDRARLREVGFSDRDIWDIGAVASFFNMTNRMAAAVDMRPNAQYHAMSR